MDSSLNKQEKNRLKSIIVKELMKHSDKILESLSQNEIKEIIPQRRQCPSDQIKIKIMIGPVDRPDMKNGIFPGYTSFQSINN